MAVKGRKLTEEEKLKVKEYHDNGTSVKELARLFNTTQVEVNRCLGIKKEASKRINSNQEAEIISKFKDGTGITALSKEYNVGYIKIKNILTKAGVYEKRNTNVSKSKDFTQEELNDILDSYVVKSESLKTIAKRYSCSSNKISKLMDEYGIAPNNSDAILNAKQQKKLVAMFNRGTSIYEICNAFNLTNHQVEEMLNSFGIFKPVKHEHRDLIDNIDSLKSNTKTKKKSKKEPKMKSSKSKKSGKLKLTDEELDKILEDLSEKIQMPEVSIDDKIAYCNKKYGEGNWKFMTKDEVLDMLLCDNHY